MEAVRLTIIKDKDLECIVGGANSADYVEIVNCPKGFCSVYSSVPTPDEPRDVLGSAIVGESFRYLGKDGKWVKIVFHGQNGFVAKKHVTPC